MNHNKSKKGLKLLLEGMKKEYNKRTRLLTIFAIVFALLTVGMFMYLNILQKENNLPRPDITFLIFFLLIAVIFILPVFHLKKLLNFEKRKNCQWFLTNPNAVTQYKIISTSPVKIVLAGHNKKVTLPSTSPELEIEHFLFQAFPHLAPQIKSEKKTKYPVPKSVANKIDKTELLNSIPDCLKFYFSDKNHYNKSFIFNPGLFFYIFIIIIAVFLINLFSSFTNIPGFWPFGADNWLYGYLILPLIAFGIAPKEKYASYQ